MTVVKGTVNFNLDMDQETSVVVQVLKRDYSSILNSALALMQQEDDLEKHQQEDLRNYIETLRAMEGVLQYYTEYSEYESWRLQQENAYLSYEKMMENAL